MTHDTIPRDAFAQYREVAGRLHDRGRSKVAQLNDASYLGERAEVMLDAIDALSVRVAELEAGRPAPPDLEPKGLQESDADAWYTVAFLGDGRVAKAVQGWANALELIRREMWMDGEAPPDEWAGWLETLADEENWTRYDADARFQFSHEVGEDCHLTIYRLFAPPIAASSERRNLEQD